MKSIKFIAGLGICILISLISILPISCKNASAQESSSTEDPVEETLALAENDFDFRTLPSGVFMEPALRQSFDTIGYVCGKFGASDNDTLYCIALGCSYYKEPEELDEYDTGYNIIDNYMLSSNSLFIPELYVKIPFLDNVQTMDLDCIDNITFLVPL